jgi:two-component system phosphate regulon sensor histidine kinase PhoR
MVFYSVCATCGLLMFAMAAIERRRLKAPKYSWVAAAAGVLVLGRLLGLWQLLRDPASAVVCLEWAMEGLALAVLLAATVWARTSTRLLTAVWLGTAAIATGGGWALCQFAPFSLASSLSVGLVVLVLLSLFGLVQWLRNRERLSPWLGVACFSSLLGAVVGLLGPYWGALLSHFVVLLLFVIETYRSVTTDWGAYGKELGAASEHSLLQTQEMALLLEVSRVIAASLDLAKVLARASEAVALAVGADWAYVLLPEYDDTEALAVASRYGWWGRQRKQDAQVHRQVMVRLGDFSLLRHAILRRRQVLANEPRDYEQFDRLHELLGRPQSGPTLVQPICLEDRALGVMLLGRVGKQQPFGRPDGDLCEGLVAQVASAIEKARLFQDKDEQARRLSELLRVRDQEAARLQSIIGSIADGVVVVGEAGEVVLVNAAAERLLGLSQGERMGRAIQRMVADLSKARGPGVEDPVIYEWDKRVLRGSLAPVTEPDGQPVGYVAVFRDVTYERQVDKAKSRLLVTISQGMRESLISVGEHVERLGFDAAGMVNHQLRRSKESISNDLERLTGLVGDLLVLSGVEQGAIQIQPQRVDVKKFIENAVRNVRYRAADRQLDLMVNLPSDLSPAWGEPAYLRRVMDNLLDNALRFTLPEGQVVVWATEAHLEHEGETPQDYVVISIRDSGVGIPLEEQERVFEPFYRVGGQPSAEVGGFGMGLAIVKSLVQAQGGHVWVESRPGEGSTFSFTLPAAGPV